MIDRGSLRLSATLLLVGQLLYIVLTQFHTGGDANDHPAIFAAYAGSGPWMAVHLGQFAGMAILLAGLLALFFGLDVQAGTARWAGRFGAASAVAALALYGALQAVDGVTLKQTVDAWVAASGPERATRFADAETTRWLEWGLQSYFRVVLGVAFLLVGAAVVTTRLVPSWLGGLLVVGGLLSLAVGVSVGYEGLESGFQDAVGIAFQLVVLVFGVGLLVASRRVKVPATRGGST